MDATLGDRVRERATSNNYWRHLGVEVLDVDEGYVRLRVAVRDEFRNAAGAPLHGGIISSLVDIAVGGALSTMHDASVGGVGQVTTDLNVTFIGAVTGESVVAEGRILRRGRTVAFGEAELTDPDTERLVAKGRATYLIVQPKS